ncbi:MAG TPA: DUF6599 family protein [Polyangiaceae bacterium]|nr:DUF6599 family protein [Polyangiaceae bacterium]
MKRLRGRGLPTPLRAVSAIALTLLATSSGCRRIEPRPRPRPSASAPLPTARSICAGGGGTVTDARFASWFPQTSGGYCVDPNADQRVFGGQAPLPLADAAELLALESAKLERLGLVEVIALTYVEDKDDPSRVAASVLRFGSPEGAYGFFGERIADAAEAGHPAFHPLAAGADAALGDTTALVVRAATVLRLDFTSRGLAPERQSAAAVPVLTGLAQAIAERLPGEAKLPPAARLLPERGRRALSRRFDALDLLEFDGVGPGALATYDDGAVHFRLALFVKQDADAAEDVLHTLRKLEGSRKLKNAPYDATRVVELEPKTGAGKEWVFGHKGVFVGGASLDAPPRAAPRGAPPERDAAILRMKRLLDGLHGAGPW